MTRLFHLVIALGILHNLIVPSTCSAELHSNLAEQLTYLQAQIDALSVRLSSSYLTCSGRVSTNEFKPYLPKGIVTYVNTSHCHFKSTPIYLTNLRGNGNNWQAVGMNSIYDAAPDKFRIYLTFVEEGGRNTTTLLKWVKEYQWELDWVGIEKL